MIIRIVTANILYTKQNKKRIEKIIFPYGNKIYIQSRLNYIKRAKTSLRKASFQKCEIAQNCPFSPSLPLPFLTVIAFHRVKKSPLIIGIINNYVNTRVSDSTVIRHRQDESLILILSNSVIHDQVPLPDLLRTTKRFLWLIWPLPAIFSSSWREFSPSLIALNPLSSAFHRRIKGSG